MKLLIVEAAALGYQFWGKNARLEFWKKLETKAIDTVFPALTCPVQASFRTASEPSSHGMIANGFFDREIRKTFFWEQSSSLFEGPRIWDEFRKKGGSVGQLCWQQSIGPESDMILTPAPIHKHNGGMIQDFYSKPAPLYKNLCRRTGKKFNLFSYWGPFTSIASTNWICNAACDMLNSGDAPDIFLVYLPHSDYDLQKYGTDSSQAVRAFKETEIRLEKLFTSAKSAKYEIAIFGDYAITEAERVYYPNRILLENGYFSARNINGRSYPDLFNSKAFAMVDHQVCHVYIRNPEDIKPVSDIFEKQNGVERVIPHNEMNHKRSGEIILEASEGCWFGYQWWTKSSEAPDYANHVDIHNKPGFDPCELFLSLWPPMSIKTDNSKIRGTHGSADPGNPSHEILWASSFKIEDKTKSLIDASKMIRSMIG